MDKMADGKKKIILVVVCAAAAALIGVVIALSLTGPKKTVTALSSSVHHAASSSTVAKSSSGSSKSSTSSSVIGRCNVSKAADGSTVYTSMDYGWSLTIPKGTNLVTEGSQSYWTIVFTDSDTGMYVKALGEYGSTSAQAEAEKEREGSAIVDVVTDNEYQESYYWGDEYTYCKEGFVGSQYLCKLEIRYPTDKASTCQPIADQILASFTPGNLDQSR